MADLDAAARALRADAVGEGHLRGALVRLARADPGAAGRLLAQLLPAQGAILEGALEYDLTIRATGTFAVSVAGGAARVRRVSRPRSRRHAAFHLDAPALVLAELLAGEERAIGRFRGPARLHGRRRALAALQALPAARSSLAEAARAGARLEPRDVHAALPYAIDPAWTGGHAFTVGHTVEGRTWWLEVRDRAGLTVARPPRDREPDATVTMSRAAFDAALRGEPAPPGERPAVRGDRAAVARLKSWIDRASGLG